MSKIIVKTYPTLNVENEQTYEYEFVSKNGTEHSVKGITNESKSLYVTKTNPEKEIYDQIIAVFPKNCTIITVIE